MKDNPPSKKEVEQFVEYRRRKAKPRFYADENFPSSAVQILRHTGARVVTAQEVGLSGHSDEDHTAYALKHGYVLLTCDRDYLDNRRFPLIHCPAIAVFDFGAGSAQEMLQAFRCLTNIFKAPQLFDKWAKFDAKRREWIETLRFLDGSTFRSRYRIYDGKLQEWIAQ